MDPKTVVIAACRQLMRPVIRILLRNGVMHREFAELCKQLYVEVAGADYGLRGRPTNTSRVALLTGLDRKEVKRLRDLAERDRAERPAASRQDRISRVLSAWYQDAEFATDAGPLELSIDGKGPSFARLVQRYGGDVPASTVLKELKRIGAAEDSGQGRLRVLKRYYMPAQSDPDALRRAGRVLEDLGNTIVHNLFRPEGTPSRFEGRASNSMMPPAVADEFRRYVEREGQRFLEKVDAWLTAHESGDTKGKQSIRLGLGVYWIEDARRAGAKK